MRRRDYTFPFRIDPGSRQAAEAGAAEHVRQMIHQLLLTSPGERADMPEIGCGLRQLLFAPHTDVLDTTTQMLVGHALSRWLGDRIEVQRVHVATPEETPDRALVLIEITYILRETRTLDKTTVRLGA